MESRDASYLQSSDDGLVLQRFEGMPGPGRSRSDGVVFEVLAPEGHQNQGDRNAENRNQDTPHGSGASKRALDFGWGHEHSHAPSLAGLPRSYVPALVPVAASDGLDYFHEVTSNSSRTREVMSARTSDQ